MDNLLTVFKTPLATLAGAYLIFLVSVYLFQSKLVYFPSKKMAADPSVIGLDFEEVRLEADDGTVLFGWYVPAENPRGTLLFFHGNAGNISHRLDSIAIFNRLGLNVFIIDYRGYGKSQGSPDETDTYRDAKRAWAFLLAQKKAAPDEIILFGRSLGAAVAAELASSVTPGGVIIESGFTSAKALARDIYAYMIPTFLVRYRYDTLAHVKTVKAPLLVIHSETDEIVPFSHGKALYEAGNEPKQFLTIQGSHNHGFITSGSRYTAGIETFVATVRPRGEK